MSSRVVACGSWKSSAQKELCCTGYPSQCTELSSVSEELWLVGSDIFQTLVTTLTPFLTAARYALLSKE